MGHTSMVFESHPNASIKNYNSLVVKRRYSTNGNAEIRSDQEKLVEVKSARGKV